MSFAFIFPGQGSQAVGMGKALADAFAPARAVFEEVDAALGEKLTRTMWEVPAVALTLTENTQPALMASSLAALRSLENPTRVRSVLVERLRTEATSVVKSQLGDD